MALPNIDTNLNIQEDGSLTGLGFLPDVSTKNTLVLPAQTSFKAVTPGVGGSGVTCNLATDTLLWRADNSLWDDTQQCFISIDLMGAGPTRRKN